MSVGRHDSSRWLLLLVLVVASSLVSCCSIELFHSSVELGEVEFDYEDELQPTTDMKDVERERTGWRISGTGDTRGFFQIFTEDWGDDDSDSIGLGGGVAAEHVLKEFNERSRLLWQFRAGLSFVYHDFDDPLDAKLFYGHSQFTGGFAGEFWGVQPQIGIQGDFLHGEYDDDGNALDIDATVDGINIGGYVGVGYRSKEFPMLVDFKVLVGDVDGITFSVGYAFGQNRRREPQPIDAL